MNDKIINLCLTGSITTNEYFAISLISFGLSEAKSWARNCEDYQTSSILQYIGNWQADDANELIADLTEDILDTRSV